MKRVLLIVGIVCILAGVVSFLAAGLNLLVYRRALDGSADFYRGLHGRMILFFVIGIVLALIGMVCILLYRKR